MPDHAQCALIYVPVRAVAHEQHPLPSEVLQHLALARPRPQDRAHGAKGTGQLELMACHVGVAEAAMPASSKCYWATIGAAGQATQLAHVNVSSPSRHATTREFSTVSRAQGAEVSKLGFRGAQIRRFNRPAGVGAEASDGPRTQPDHRRGEHKGNRERGTAGRRSCYRYMY